MAERRQAQAPDRERVRANLAQVVRQIANIIAAIKDATETAPTKES
ncbi:MAG: hypothetical protein ACT4OO_16375 [Nitrospiraceae bacterium]